MICPCSEGSLAFPVLSLDWLLNKMGVVVMVVPMMMVVYDHHNLALRRIGHCKAEQENYTGPELVHSLL